MALADCLSANLSAYRHLDGHLALDAWTQATARLSPAHAGPQRSRHGRWDGAPAPGEAADPWRSPGGCGHNDGHNWQLWL